MERKSFFDKYGMIIVIILLSLVFLQTCNSPEKKLKKEVVKLEQKVDSLMVNMVTMKQLQIEGLKNEKRMIQATDRKMLDVQRQNAIDEEIKRLMNE